ncbi:hypothetical protein E2C01_027995 [Portunus trituberculatus]|uniref:Uncharacterized protein n=1 Tax=Portunus trituberculatus TaxID=210409 RepID=A0A5B7EN50_PORTR|nr:hypothetical protein [Portunus trituberculatus]
MPPHLPCNITNGRHRCSQLLHHGLQLAAVRGASWRRRFPLVVRLVHKAALAPLTGQRNESCVAPLASFGGISSPFFKCCCGRWPSVQAIPLGAVGMEGEGGRNRLTAVKVTFPSTRPLSWQRQIAEQRVGGAAGRGAIVAIIVFRHVRGILDDGGSDAGLVREESRVRREVFVVLVLARVAGCSSRQEPWRPSMAEGNVSCTFVSL